MDKIKEYIEILEQCHKEQNYSGKSEDFVDHLNLIESGYLGSSYGTKEPYSHSSEGGFRAYNIVITPKGVTALVEWKSLIYENSFLGKISKLTKVFLTMVLGWLISKLDVILDLLVKLVD